MRPAIFLGYEHSFYCAAMATASALLNKPVTSIKPTTMHIATPAMYHTDGSGFSSIIVLPCKMNRLLRRPLMGLKYGFRHPEAREKSSNRRKAAMRPMHGEKVSEIWCLQGNSPGESPVVRG